MQSARPTRPHYRLTYGLDEELETIVVATAEGRFDRDAIEAWLRPRLRRIA